MHLFTLTHTLGRTPLDQGSASRRVLYLTKHITHKKQIAIAPAGFEPTMPAGLRPPRSVKIKYNTIIIIIIIIVILRSVEL